MHVAPAAVGNSTLKPLVPEELNPPLNYTVIHDVEGLEKVSDFLKRKSVFVIDTETNMVDRFYDRRIRTIQIGDKDEQYVIDLLSFASSAGIGLDVAQAIHTDARNSAGSVHPCLAPVVDVLRPALESGSFLKVGHNLRFDYGVLKFCLGLRMWNLYDTMVAEQVLYTGKYEFLSKGIWALDDVVARYAGLLIDKSSQTSFDLVSPLTTKQVVYCALDCRLPFAIKNGQYPQLQKANLLYTCSIEFDAIPAFEDMRLNGLLIDEDLWNALLEKVRADHSRNIDVMDRFFVPIVGTKDVPAFDLVKMERDWRDCKEKEQRAEYRKTFMSAKKSIREAVTKGEKYEGLAAIAYSSPAQILQALRKAGFSKAKLKSSNDRDLKRVAEHPSWDLAKAKKASPDLSAVGVIDAVRLYRETAQLIKSYGEFLTKYKDPDTGRIHSEIKQLGAETGRTSSNKPNVQNIPRGSDWRSCFIARPGYKIITLDYNGCELRILAEYSREPAFVEAFLQGWDVHSVGAEIIFGDKWRIAAAEGCAYYKVVDGKQLHEKCSCPLHKELRDQIKAINFGIAYGMEAKKLSESIGVTEEEAQKLLNIYRKAFPVLVKYLERSGKEATMKMESRTLAQRRRLYHKPTYAEAIVKAQLKAVDKRGPGALPTQNEITWAYKAMYSAIEREGKNTPIQGSNADIAKIAMGCGYGKDSQPFMWHKLETVYQGRLINFIHDEFVVEVPEDTNVANLCFDWVADCMTRAGAELVKSIPMTTEGHIDTKWKK